MIEKRITHSLGRTIGQVKLASHKGPILKTRFRVICESMLAHRRFPGNLVEETRTCNAKAVPWTGPLPRIYVCRSQNRSLLLRASFVITDISPGKYQRFSLFLRDGYLDVICAAFFLFVRREENSWCENYDRGRDRRFWDMRSNWGIFTMTKTYRRKLRVILDDLE